MNGITREVNVWVYQGGVSMFNKGSNWTVGGCEYAGDIAFLNKSKIKK